MKKIYIVFVLLLSVLCGMCNGEVISKDSSKIVAKSPNGMKVSYVGPFEKPASVQGGAPKEFSLLMMSMENVPYGFFRVKTWMFFMFKARTGTNTFDIEVMATAPETGERDDVKILSVYFEPGTLYELPGTGGFNLLMLKLEGNTLVYQIVPPAEPAFK